MTEQSLKAILPPRKLVSHKGDYGHLLVLSGSVGMTGAAYLCAQAAVLMGSGLVTLGIPRSLNPIMEVKLTEVMTLPLPETDSQTLGRNALTYILDFLPKVSSLAIGPGLSVNPQTRSLIRTLIGRLDKPFVLDADGINALSGKAETLRKIKTECIITPHPGEMARLAGITTDYIQNKRRKVAVSFAKKHKVTVVLKGYRTVVAGPEGRIYINKTGNPGMASGGVGDILTGMVGSLLGQGISAWNASRLGVYLHGLAGDLAVSEKGMVSLCATDLLNKLPVAIQSVG